MNNYYTLHSLVDDLRYKILEKEIIQVWSSRKDQLDFYLSTEFQEKIVFSATSPGTALFFESRSRPPAKNAALLFKNLQGLRISGLSLMSDYDRYLKMTFHESRTELVFKPFSSRPNVFEIKEDRIVSSFKDEKKWIGKPAPKAVTGTESNVNGFHSFQSDSISEAELSALPFKKRILECDKRFPRWLLQDPEIIRRLDIPDIQKLMERLKSLQMLLLHPQDISITSEGNICLLPAEYHSQIVSENFPAVNDAVRSLFYAQDRKSRLLPGKRDLLKKLENRLMSLAKQQKQLDRDPERIENADRYEKYGHLLMSQPDADHVTSASACNVTDWENQGTIIPVPVSPGNTLIHQAQNYYEKAARIRKEITLSGKKKKLVSDQTSEIVKMKEEVSKIDHPSDLDKWLKKNEDRLQVYGFTAAGKKSVSRPYRSFQIGGYEVWVGKNAKSNDQILALSHKEDIWMHVSGAAGSHVVLRTRGDAGWPDQSLVLKAASLAAAWSRLSGSSLVPVIIAKRKHVRKPKGAAQGEVTVLKKRVEMVVPEKPNLPES